MCAAFENHLSAKTEKQNGLILYYHKHSYYSQKVLMALHEKKLAFESHVINLIDNIQYEPWFLKINPRGEVPVLQDNGKFILDSTRIIDYLEDRFFYNDVPKLIPIDESLKIQQKIIYFRYIIDHIQSGVITIGSFYHPEFATNPKPPYIGPIRKVILDAEKQRTELLKQQAESNPNVRNALLRKVEFRNKRLEFISNKEEFLKILSDVENTLDNIEEELASHTEDQENWWLCGSTFTIADISLAILLERLNQLGFEYRFWKNNKRPHIEKYFARIKQRESFQRSVPNTLQHIKVFVESHKQYAIGLSTIAFSLLFAGYLIIKRLK